MAVDTNIILLVSPWPPQESFSEDLLGDIPGLEQGEAVLVGPYVPIMIKTATRETRHGGRTPDIYRLLSEAWERAKAEKEDEELFC